METNIGQDNTVISSTVTTPPGVKPKKWRRTAVFVICFVLGFVSTGLLRLTRLNVALSHFRQSLSSEKNTGNGLTDGSDKTSEAQDQEVAGKQTAVANPITTDPQSSPEKRMQRAAESISSIEEQLANGTQQYGNNTAAANRDSRTEYDSTRVTANISEKNWEDEHNALINQQMQIVDDLMGRGLRKRRR